MLFALEQYGYMSSAQSGFAVWSVESCVWEKNKTKNSLALFHMSHHGPTKPAWLWLMKAETGLICLYIEEEWFADS